MYVRLLLLIGFSAWLFGCSSGQTKEEQQVTIEGMSSGATLGNGAGGAKTYGADYGSDSTFSELDDPSSQLSPRIIYFEYDSSDIKEDYRPVIEAHARYLAKNPDKNIILEGHTDERGSREYNLALGERRARSVRQEMMLLGARDSQIRLVSYGEERPAMHGHDEYSWQQNRRVEIIY